MKFCNSIGTKLFEETQQWPGEQPGDGENPMDKSVIRSYFKSLLVTDKMGNQQSST